MYTQDELKAAFKAGYTWPGTDTNWDEAQIDAAYDAWRKSDVEQREFQWELDLPVRVHNALYRWGGCRTVRDVRWWLTPQCDLSDPGEFDAEHDHGDADCHKVIRAYDLRGMGLKSVDQARDALRRYDAKIAREVADA